MLIFQGNETSALVTSHMLLMLAMHQDMQERVVNELREVYETATSRSTIESISKLHYLEQVMKETLRLMPTGIFLARECQADTEISMLRMCARVFNDTNLRFVNRGRQLHNTGWFNGVVRLLSFASKRKNMGSGRT